MWQHTSGFKMWAPWDPEGSLLGTTTDAQVLRRGVTLAAAESVLAEELSNSKCSSAEE